MVYTSIHRPLQIAVGVAISTIAVALPSIALGQSLPAASAGAPIPGSDALTTQPAQLSLSDLVEDSDGRLRVSDRPTLVFSYEESAIEGQTTSPRQQIEQNKPENSNAIHFPLGDR
ncbi:MAG: hypothetical protein AAF289_07370 [Cyanobacteria bacterium P01_A01_bin.135]